MTTLPFTVCVTGRKDLWKTFASLDEAIEYLETIPAPGKAVYHRDIYVSETGRNGETVQRMPALSW